MADLIVPTIVEGHGEVHAVPVLLRRLAIHLAPGTAISFPPPIRVPRGSFVNRADDRKRVVKLASLKARDPEASFILALFDSDDDCPASLGPDLLAKIQEIRREFSMAVTLAKQEFEAWFLAAAESL